MQLVEQELLNHSGVFEFTQVFCIFICGVRVVHVVELHIFSFLVPCCHVHYDFHVLCIYLRIMVSFTWISLSDDIRVI